MKLMPRRHPADPVMVRARRLLRSQDRKTRRDRASRLARILRSFRQDYGLWPSTEAYEYFCEARLCWVAGASIACVVMCRVALEELLRAPLAMEPDDTEEFRLAFGGRFEQLINHAVARGWCTREEGSELHWIRRQANSYIQTRPLGGRTPAENAKQVREHVRRWSRLDPETHETVSHTGVVGDADRALHAVLAFRRSRVTRF